MSFYYNTRRIIDILNNSTVLNYGELDSKVLKIECFNYLAKVYCVESSEPLTNFDYANLEDITYRFCLPNFGEEFNNSRILLTRNHIQSLRKGKITLNDLMLTLSVNFTD